MALTITIPGAVEATIGATAPAILTVGVGVPGATGPAGATGAQGPQGDPGEGVPVGGTAGQVLAKIDGTNYNTEWVNVEGDYLPLSGGAMDANASITASDTSTATDSELAGWGLGVQLSADHTKGTTVEFDGLDTYDGASHMQVTPTGITFPDATTQSTAGRSLTDYDFTNNYNTKLTTYGLIVHPPVAENPANYDSFVNTTEVRQSYDDTEGESLEGTQIYASYANDGIVFKRQNWINGPEGPPAEASYVYGVALGSTGLRFINWNGTTRGSTTQYLKTGITFPDASVQTIAFPGFNNVALTGNPTAPTAALADNDTSIATTAFVQQELLSGTANARNLEVYVRNQTGSTIPIGSIVYINGATGNRPTITLAQANNDTNSAQTIGFTKTAITNNGFGFVIIRGELEGLNTSALTEGAQLYLSPTTAGTWTTTKPSAPQHLVYVGVVIRSHPTLGTILVSVQNGYEVAELHDSAISGLADNDLFAYESSTDLWKNKSFATLGLAGLNSPAFTGTPSLPTGTTGITQSAGNNTTALATTAFVTAAVPAFATVQQALVGTSTTTVISPLGYKQAGISTNIWAPGIAACTALQSGTGATTSSGNSVLVGQLISPNASVAGYATRGFTIHFHANSPSLGAAYNFSGASGHSVRVYAGLFASTLTGVKIRGVFGRMQATITTPTPLVARAYGWEWDWSTRTLNIIAHNGTTLTTTPVTFNPLGFRTYEFTATSDGAGTISLYVDGVLLGTSSGGPTGLSNANTPWWQVEIQSEATATSGNVNINISNPKLYTTNG